MLKLEILASLAVLMCGQILLWRRRDNVFGYQQVGLFVSSALIPILGTTVLDDAEPAVVHRYASILAVGAAGYLVGLMYGASIGFRWRLPRVSFSSPFTTMPPVLVRRIRLAALASAAALVASYLLLGYVPLLAADRQSAKYGVGAYQAGFARGAAVYHLALALAGAAIAVLLALVAIRRRPRDVLLLAVIGIGLALTLSRGQALTGPLVFLMAWGIQRRWRPWKILAIACSAFLASAFVNQIVFIPAPTANSSFASDVAASAPDVTDHLGFLHGFEVSGSQQIGLKTILAGASPSKGEWDPGDYALRMRTGLPDVSQLASGGIRLPVPVWGYASYGFVGAAIFSFLAGLFTGWGTTLVRRMLTGAQRTKHQALNLVLAWIFFNGTFDVLAGFSFLERSNVAVTLLAIGLCLGRRLRPRPEPSTETRTGAPYSVLGSAGGAPVS